MIFLSDIPRKLILSFLFFVWVASPNASAQNCLNLLRYSIHQSETQLSTTEGFIAYLELLLEKRMIGERELDRLIDSLKEGQMINPIDESKADLKSELYEHFKGVQEYLGREDLDQKKILEWARERLKTKEREKVERSEVEQETVYPYRQLELGLVPAGSFKMREEGQEVSVTLTHPFRAMTTPATQLMWAKVMGENPSFFADGEQTIMVKINGKEVKLQPDHPVERVTWWSVVVFANRLSEKHGLKPAYDLSGIVWNKDTRAENGTLDIESGEIQINAPDGDYYEAEGFRLPTEAEQEYLLRAARTTESKDHAWHSENGDGMTHPVAELKPLRILSPEGESIFYDLYGNVREWGWNLTTRWKGKTQKRRWKWMDRWKSIKKSINPTGPLSATERVIRGGGWYENLYQLQSLYRGSRPPHERCRVTGFRLVRTVK